MKFRNKEEWQEAMIATAIYLPEMIRLYEDGLKLLGAKILKKYAYRSKDGDVDPAYLIQAQNKQFEFRLGNAMKEFVSVDREEKPMRFDYKINDPEQARAKLARIIGGRLEIARAMIEAKTPEELKQRLQEMSHRFERIRVWSYDELKEKDADN
jgi:hypothetical protein